MPRSCDAGTCSVDATAVATFKNERGETLNKFACSLVHQHQVGRELLMRNYVPEWRQLPKADPPPAVAP